jgi:hypothetical protein
MRRIESIVSCIESGIAKEIRMESTISTKDLKAELDRFRPEVCGSKELAL